MKLRYTTHLTVSRAVLTLLFLGCCCSSGHASDARKSKWDNLSTTRARIEFLEDPKRVAGNQPDRVLDVVGVGPGDVVADVGCGTGVFTFRLADRVGKGGKVYAVDILDDMLAFVDTKMKRDKATNIILVKSSDSDPHLPAACCDKILLIDTYQHIGNRVSFVSKLYTSLKEKGKVAIVTPVRSTTQEQTVIREMEKQGFRFTTKYDFMIKRYFLVFTK